MGLSHWGGRVSPSDLLPSQSSFYIRWSWGFPQGDRSMAPLSSPGTEVLHVRLKGRTVKGFGAWQGGKKGLHHWYIQHVGETSTGLLPGLGPGGTW